MLFILILIYHFVPVTRSQWPSLAAFKMRFPGSCQRGEFDCGFGRCIPLERLHDGRADCLDLSDEYCFAGHIRCGSYCVDPRYSSQCLINPRCDSSPTSPPFCSAIKEKLCNVKGTIPCKGFGECVLPKWLADGKADCLDGSDEDEEYVAVFDFIRAVDSVTYEPIVPVVGMGSATQQSFFTITPRTLHPFTEAVEAINAVHSKQLPPVSGTPIIEPHHNPYGGSKTPANPFDSIQLTSTMPTLDASIVPFWTELNVHPTIASAVRISTLSQSSTRDALQQPPHLLPRPAWPYDASMQTPSAPASFTGEITTAPITWSRLISSIEHPQVSTHADFESESPTSTSITGFPEQPSFALSTPSATAAKEIAMPVITEWRPVDTSTRMVADELGPVQGATAAGSDSAGVPPVPVSSITVAPVGIQLPVPSVTRGPYPWTLLNVPATVVPVTEAIIAPTISSFASDAGGSAAVHEFESKSFATLTASTASISSASETQEPTRMSDSASDLQSGLSPSTITTEMFLTTDNAEWEAIMESRRGCAKSFVENAKQTHPNPMCGCSVGQMPTSAGRCEEAEISTFGVYLEEICEGIKMNAEDRPYLVMQKLSETLPYAMCIRKDSDPLVINALCNDQCTIDSFIEKYRESGDPEVPVKLIEFERSACSESDMNDCDEKAECIPSGLQYKCVCGPGTNDTSNGKGHSCEGVLIADACVELFGICIIFWILLFLLLLLFPLLCCIGWFLYRHRKSAKEREEQANLVTVDVEGQRNHSSNGRLTEPITILRRSDDDEYLNRPLEILSNGGANTLIKPSNSIKKFGLIRTKTIETDDDVTILEPALADNTPQTNSSTDTSLSNKTVTIIAPSERHEPQTEVFGVKEEPKKEEDSVDDKPIDSASRKSSTPSGGSSPTIWDAFKILGMQYIKRHSIKSRRSSSASLDELIRAREQKKTPSVTPRLESTTKLSSVQTSVPPDEVAGIVGTVGSPNIPETDNDQQCIMSNKLSTASETSEKEFSVTEENTSEANVSKDNRQINAVSEVAIKKSDSSSQQEACIQDNALNDDTNVRVFEESTVEQPKDKKRLVKSKQMTVDSVQNRMNEIIETVVENEKLSPHKPHALPGYIESVNADVAEMLSDAVANVAAAVHIKVTGMEEGFENDTTDVPLPLHIPVMDGHCITDNDNEPTSAKVVTDKVTATDTEINDSTVRDTDVSSVTVTGEGIGKRTAVDADDGEATATERDAGDVIAKDPHISEMTARGTAGGEVSTRNTEATEMTERDLNVDEVTRSLRPRGADMERNNGIETDSPCFRSPTTARRAAANCLEDMLEKLEQSELTDGFEDLSTVYGRSNGKNKEDITYRGALPSKHRRPIYSEHGGLAWRTRKMSMPSAERLERSARDMALIDPDINFIGNGMRKPLTSRQKMKLSASYESLRYNTEPLRSSNIARLRAQSYSDYLGSTDEYKISELDPDVDTELDDPDVNTISADYHRFDAPQRKLSSISEKSAELTSEEIDEVPSSKSCPNTTRINDDFKVIPELRRKFRRKFRRRFADKNEFLKNAANTSGFGSELDAAYFRRMPDICSKFKAKMHRESKETPDPVSSDKGTGTLDIDLGSIETHEEQIPKSSPRKSGKGTAEEPLSNDRYKYPTDEGPQESGMLSGAVTHRSDSARGKQHRSSFENIEREILKNSDGSDRVQTSGESSAEYRNYAQAYIAPRREAIVRSGDEKAGEEMSSTDFPVSQGRRLVETQGKEPPRSPMSRGGTPTRDPNAETRRRHGRYGSDDLNAQKWNTAPNTSDSESGAPSDDVTTKRFAKRRSLDVKPRPPLLELHKHKPSTTIERKIASRRRESMASHSARLDMHAGSSAVRSTSSSISGSDEAKKSHVKPPWDSSPLKEGQLDVIAPIKSYIFPTQQDDASVSVSLTSLAHCKMHRSVANSPCLSYRGDHLRDRSQSLANFKAKIARDKDTWVAPVGNRSASEQPLVKENLWWGHP